MLVKPCLSVLLLLLIGCATLAGKPTAVSPCSFEQVWDTSIAALGDFPLESVDKTAGTLATKWVEVEGARPAGFFQRDVNKERLKYVVEVNRDGPGATAMVTQLREEFSPMGVRMRGWRGIPGNPSEETAVVTEISRRLKEKGC